MKHFWQSPHRNLGIILLLTIAVHWTGIQWGLPSRERADMVLTPEQKNDSFYHKLAQARQGIYQSLKWGNTLAHTGYEVEQTGEATTGGFFTEGKDMAALLLHSFSSFLVRSQDGDEQIVFVRLADIKPKQREFVIKPAPYGGVYLYSLGATLFAASLLKQATLVSDITYYYRHPEAMARIYAIGRFFNAFLAVPLVLALYLLIRQLHGPTAAFWGSLLWITAPSNILLSHVIKPHLMVTLCSLLALWAALKVLEQDSRPWHIVGGLASGLALGSSYAASIIIFALPTAHAYRKWNQRQGRGLEILFDKNLWLYGAIASTTLLITNPSIWVYPHEWYYSVKGFSYGVQTSWSPLVWLKGYANTLIPGFGIPALLLFAIGVLTGWKKGQKADRFLLIWIALYLAYVSFNIGTRPITNTYMARYFTLPMTFAAIYMGLGADSLKGILPRFGSRLLLSLVAITSLSVAFAYVYLYASDNPKQALNMQAGRWIMEKVPPGSSIGLHDYPHLDFTPPFQFSKYKLEIPDWKNLKPKNLPTYFLLYRNPALDARPGPRLPWPEFFNYYEILKDFQPKIFSRWRFNSMFSEANFSVWICRKKETNFLAVP